MKVIDLHCDTILEILNSKGTKRLNKNNLCVDMEKLIKGGYEAQFFAMFIDLKTVEDPFIAGMEMFKCFYEELQINNHIAKQAFNYQDLINNERDNKISCFLTIEEGGAIKGDLNNLRRFHECGVRLITLTWNYQNEIGYPNAGWKFSDKGLTEFGIAMVEEMNNLNMIIDVSHLSDKGFYDVVSYSKEPFVASHSNSRFITNHSRNLTDDMIRILSEKGGIMGINFCSLFLGNNEMSMIEDMVKHIQHILKIGGSQVIALGSDFDGIGNKVEISDCSEMDKLALALRKVGVTEDVIEKIFFRNAIRVIKDVMK